MAAWGNRPYADTMRANLRGWYDLARRADPSWRHEMSSPDEVDRWYEGGTAPERGDDEPAITGRTLPKGTQLQQGKYVVDRVLGQGGFGITYLAEDTALRRHVAIKELFPPGCVRHANAVVRPNFHAPLTATKFDLAKVKFLKEAQTLARFDDPGIVRVYTVFTENNTAYMVMRYLRGRTLGERLKESGGVLSEPEAVRYVDAIGQALSKLHEAGVLHRDVTPENALVTDGRPVLVDFGEAREFTADVTESMEVGITPGYAPLELYGGASKADAYTDVYALGATLYRLVTGKRPVEAPVRVGGPRLRPPHEVNAEVSEKISKAVMKSMAIRAADRYQTVDEFLNALASREPARPPPPTPATPAAPTLTRDDGSCRASWANVDGATGYDLRWRQRGAWMVVPNVVSPRTIAPVVDNIFVEVQVRAKNGSVPSEWSPVTHCPGTPPSPPRRMWKRIVFGVALLVAAAIAIEITTRGTGWEGQGSTDSREETDSSNSNSKAPREDQGGTSLRGDDGLVPGDNGGTASVEDTDSAPSPMEDGGLSSPAEPEPRVADLTFPLIESLERSAPSAHRTNADSVTWRITFTEAISSVDKADFTIVGIRPWSLTVTKVNDSGSVYDITLNSHALADHNGTIALALSPSRTIEDLAGNDLVNRSLSGDVEFVVDNTGPAVTIDGVPATDSGAFMATFTFSEEVTGFTASDVRVANATASAFTEVQAGRRWHVRITPTGDSGLGDGAIPDSIEVSRYGIWLPADQVTDLAGNGNTASTRHTGSYGRDVTDPRLLSIVRQTPSNSPTQADSITWRVTFSEDVQHFTTSSVNLLEDRSDRVIRRSADRVSTAGSSESAYDVTFGGLASYSGRVRLNFQVRSDGTSYYIVDKAARSLLCCDTIGTDESTFDLDNAPAVTERRRGSYGDVSTWPGLEPELDPALLTRGGSSTSGGRG